MQQGRGCPTLLRNALKMKLYKICKVLPRKTENRFGRLCVGCSTFMRTKEFHVLILTKSEGSPEHPIQADAASECLWRRRRRISAAATGFLILAEPHGGRGRSQAPGGRWRACGRLQQLLLSRLLALLHGRHQGLHRRHLVEDQGGLPCLTNCLLPCQGFVESSHPLCTIDFVSQYIELMENVLSWILTSRALD